MLFPKLSRVSSSALRFLSRCRGSGLGFALLVLLAAMLLSFAQTSGPARPNLSFEIIETNNIFNGSRLPARPRAPVVIQRIRPRSRLITSP